MNEIPVPAADVAPPIAAAPEQQVAPAAAPQQAAPEAAPFNPLDISSVAASFAADRAKLSAPETLPARDESGKFVAESAPAGEPNPPVPQPDSEPMVEFGEAFGKIPAKEVPAFVEQLVAHRTQEFQQKLAEITNEVPTLKQQLVAIQRQAQEAIEERNQLLAWGQQDPQSLATFLQSLPRVPQATNPMFGTPPAQPNQTPAQFLTPEQAKQAFDQMWQAKLTEQQTQAAQAQAEAAENARVNGIVTQRLSPIIGSLPEGIQTWVKETVGWRMQQDRTMHNAPETVLIQRMVAETQKVVNEINTLNATRVAAQKQLAANTAPPVKGGPVPAPRVDRSGFNPLDFNSVHDSFRAERARLQGM